MAGEKFTLPDETVEIRFIKRQSGGIVDPKHIAYGGLLPDKGNTYYPRMLDNGKYANVLTNEEKEFLQEELSLGKDGLSVYKKENNYWDTAKITLLKEGIVLRLKDPEQYIKLKILEAYTDSIAPNLAAIPNKATYKFVIVRKNDEAKITMSKLEITKEAYRQLGKIEDNREAMIDFLLLHSIKVAKDTDMVWVSAEVGKIFDKSPEKFVATLKDPDYSTRILLVKAVMAGEVTIKNGGYYSKDGTALVEPNQTPNLVNTILYLKNNVNQEYKLLLMGKVK